MAAPIRSPGAMQAEGNDLVRCVVADVRPAEPRDAGAGAPVARDCLDFGAERAVVLGYVADAPEPQPRQSARCEAGGDVKEGAVEGIEIFAHFLDQQDVARQVGFERSEEHTSELQSLMRISYAVFCLKKKKH